MTADDQKKAAALAALAFVPDNAVVGVGTGSTVNHFIDALAAGEKKIACAVSSSEASTARLERHGIVVVTLDEVLRANRPLPVYIDGADEIDPEMAMIKGGGGALTREKIIAEAAERFICIVDNTKQVSILGRFALPVEVIPMAVALISDRLSAIGAEPVLRDGFVTDNGNAIIDAHGLKITDPCALEVQINQWPGVVTVGLFALRGADICLVGTPDGVQRIDKA